MSQSEPTSIDLAYLAGIIDADGYISIQRSKHRSRGTEKLYYAPRIGIAGTNRKPHDFAARFWGGKVTVSTPKALKNKVQFQWSRVGWVAIQMIEALTPFLKVKQEQALLAWELWDHLEAGRGVDPFPWFGPYYDPIPDRDEMWARMVVLNDSRNHLRTRNAQQFLEALAHRPFPWEAERN